jgi:hypothetical protein
MKRLHHLHIIVLFLLVVGPASVRADDSHYDCVVVEHLQLTERGYRPYRASDKLGNHFTINKQSGAVMGLFDLAGFEWQRVRVV